MMCVVLLVYLEQLWITNCNGRDFPRAWSAHTNGEWNNEGIIHPCSLVD